ncbi:ras-like protein [Anaeramoeba flamelloides]|uniref:Ras-like protein n=1 Tax=Anaeramoeba flamelloides TaxID=1746091 RepID=A0ABQ8XX65_9EUKA|nr:ras-like protein [Anaeramoeba flamelloides]
MTEYKIIIVGRGGVGKTALMVRFVQNTFIEEYDPTIEEEYRRQIVIDEETYTLDILDTGGNEEYSIIRDVYMRKGDGFLIVYSINARNSFDEVQKYYEQITGAKDSDDVPIVVVGNKSDLENERKISKYEGTDISTSLNCSFIETSAKESVNVEQAFTDLVHKINKHRLEYPKKTNSQNRRSKSNRCEIF